MTKSPIDYIGHDTFMPYVLNRTTAALNADFQLFLRQQGLTLLHWRVLAFLEQTDGLGVSALAQKTDSDQATLSRALMVLEKKGFIDRRPCAADQRGVNIHLLAAGKAIFYQVLPVAVQLHERAVKGFSPAEQQQLNEFLNRVRANVSTENK